MVGNYSREILRAKKIYLIIGRKPARQRRRNILLSGRLARYIYIYNRYYVYAEDKFNVH